MMIVWFYTRCIMMPYCTYNVWAQGSKYMVFDRYIFPEHGVTMPIYVYLLSILCVLHYYWFSLFVGMISKYFITGIGEDAQNDIRKNMKKNQ